MLVSHRKKFIFTKTKKTAGTSVESVFEPYCLPEGTWKQTHYTPERISADGIIGYRGNGGQKAIFWNHMPAELIRNRIGEDIWNEYFKFTVIRNPFDKLVSGFYMHWSQVRQQNFLQHRGRLEFLVYKTSLISNIFHLNIFENHLYAHQAL